MPVDPDKKRIVLVVHGVQPGTDDDIDSHIKIKDLMLSRSGATTIDFDTDIYKYEDINDDARSRLGKVFSFFSQHLVDKIPIGGLVGQYLDAGVDLISDVLINLSDGSTAETIRKGLQAKLVNYYEEGNPLYVVAHSLGSIYTFDVINNLIGTDNGLFDRNDRKTWPVQGLVTIGSPIGLSMFGRDHVNGLGAGDNYFRWINHWAATDPVVSGNFYGKPLEKYKIAEEFSPDPDASGWEIRDRKVDTGKAWLMAHTSYWNDPGVGDDLWDMINF